MKPGTQELYKINCRFEKECNPEPRIKKFQNGTNHYVTQCTTCGCSFGTPFSKQLLDSSLKIKPFDEEFEKKYYDEIFTDSFSLSEIQKKLQKIRKQLKVDYFRNILNLPIDDFYTAYQAYLNSPIWGAKRQRILKRDNHICQYCQSAKATQVHHLSYTNLGNESDFELLSVCYNCHQVIHELDNNENFYDQNKKKEL